MMVTYHSRRERQYEHDQQGGNDDTPDSRRVSHCE